MEKNRTDRNRSVEFLRIISMFMILMLHSNGHGGGIKPL